eukprot:m.3041 g.3041  ORF g.3041 m.3041 type:complete len:168 (+) comp4382_c0_seq1:290-793(+)
MASSSVSVSVSSLPAATKKRAHGKNVYHLNDPDLQGQLKYANSSLSVNVNDGDSATNYSATDFYKLKGGRRPNGRSVYTYIILMDEPGQPSLAEFLNQSQIDKPDEGEVSKLRTRLEDYRTVKQVQDDYMPQNLEAVVYRTCQCDPRKDPLGGHGKPPPEDVCMYFV